MTIFLWILAVIYITISCGVAWLSFIVTRGKGGDKPITPTSLAFVFFMTIGWPIIVLYTLCYGKKSQ